MGGKAIEGARRIDKVEYEALLPLIKSGLEKIGIVCRFLNVYESKETFGDIDVLVIVPRVDGVDWTVPIRNLFVPTQEFHNNDVYSIGFLGVQIDFIRVDDAAAMEMAGFYFDYNDLGNLVGRIAHAKGLKFGHDGLWLPVRAKEDDALKLGDILLSVDRDAILTHLGFSVENYGKFDTLESIFEYVIDGKGFAKELYPLEHRSHDARVRDRKRPTYTKFLTYLTEHNPADNHVYSERKEYHQQLAAIAFGKLDVYNLYHVNHERDRLIKKFWNGGLVSEWTGLEYKELGDFMKWMLDAYHHGNKEHHQQRVVEMVLSGRVEDIESWTRIAYNIFVIMRKDHA